MLCNDTLEIVVNICLFLILVIPIIWPKWIFNEHQPNFLKRLRFGVLILFLLSLVIYLSNREIKNNNQASQNSKDAVITDMGKDLKSIKAQLPDKGFYFDSLRKLIAPLKETPNVIYRDITNDGTDVILCGTDQMNLKTLNASGDSLQISADFCSTIKEVKDFSIDNVELKKNGNTITSYYTKRGKVVNLSWGVGNRLGHSIGFKIDAPLKPADTLIMYYKLNWRNKEKGESAGPKRIYLNWDNSTNQFVLIVNQDLIDTIIKKLKEGKLY